MRKAAQDGVQQQQGLIGIIAGADAVTETQNQLRLVNL